MKKTFYQYFTLFMASLVLLSSTGFGILEHQCLMKGKSIQLLSYVKNKSGCKIQKASSCCNKSKVVSANDTFLKKSQCCKDSQKYENLDTTSSSSHFISKVLKHTSEGLPWMIKSVVFIQSEWNNPTVTTFLPPHSFSSLHYGRGMLHFIQLWLI